MGTEKQRLPIRIMVFGLLLLGSTSVGQEPGQVIYRGNAYDLETGKFLFAELHTETQKNFLTRAAHTLFTNRTGHKFAEQSATFSGRLSAPEYTFTDYRDEHIEKVEKVDAGFKLGFKRNKKEPWVYKTLNSPALHTVPGFRNFITLNWETLIAGESIEFKAIVVPNKDYFTFKVNKVKETTIGDKEAYVFRISVSSFVIRMLTDSMFLTLQKDNKQLLQYRGIHFIRDNVEWQGHKVVINYSYH